MGICHKHSKAIAICLVLFTLPTWARSPRLTGRWGDARTPHELIVPSGPQATKGLVVITMASTCPLGARLVPQLNTLSKTFRPLGIEFVALYPNGFEETASMALHALDTEFNWPVFLDDRTNPLYALLKMSVTPEVVFLDTRGGFNPNKIIYQGKVNELWSGGGTARDNTPFLENALRAFLNRQPAPISETAASGCRINRRVNRAPDRRGVVTYYKDIVPILNRTCLQCHREGEAGAELFSELTDYDTVAGLYDTLMDQVESRAMPPWHAQMANPQKHGGLVGDIRLSAEEIDTLRAWGEQDLAEGSPEDAPTPPTWPTPGQWRIGKPDFVFRMQEAYVVPKQKLDEYQYYRIRANFPEDRYIQAIELRPGNQSVVHHMGAIVGPASDDKLTGTQAMLKLYGLTGDKIRKVGDYVPGDEFNARTYPPGFALKLPKGSDVIFEMHYTPTGKAEVPDVSEMGIVWAKGPPDHLIETQVFNRKDVRLPPFENHIELTNHYAFSTDVRIYAAAPHMHFRGKSYVLYKVRNPGTPEEAREALMKIPTYDFNWQRTYEFEKPVELKAGDALLGVAVFDNSHFNPHNPDPADFVRFGLKSDQEMMNLRVKFERVELAED